MKYTGESAKKIRDLRMKNPLMDMVEIGKSLGVSKQYVHKILKKSDFHTGVPKKRTIRLCRVCRQAIASRKHSVVCSSECKEKLYLVDVVCSFCHYKFKRKRSQVARGHREGYKRIYCSLICRNKGRKDYIRGQGSRFHDYQR